MATNALLVKSEAIVVALWPEELVDKRQKNSVVEFVVNLAAEDTLRDQCAKGIPWNLVRVNIGPVLAHAIDPLIDAVEGAALVTLIKLIRLGPANGSVAQTLLHNSVEPRDNEMQPLPLNWFALCPLLGYSLRVRAD